MAVRHSTLIIGCGALAREMISFAKAANLTGITIACLPAHLHNTPKRIPAALQRKIRSERDRHDRIFLLYGDCGTAGEVDRICEQEGVERIAGSHCYEFYLGRRDFQELAEAEPACFFLTDFLARHFQRLVVRGLGLDRHPELREDYFGNYRKLVYLAQTDDPDLDNAARRAATYLGLEYERRLTGLGEMEGFMLEAAAS